MRCLLRHPYHLISNGIRRHLHRFHGSNRPQCLSTPSARPNGLLAWFFDLACSFRLSARSHGCWDVSHRVRCRRQPFRGHECPRHLLTSPACPYGLWALYLDVMCSFQRRARSSYLYGIRGRCGHHLVRPLHHPGCSAPLECCQVRSLKFFVSSLC